MSVKATNWAWEVPDVTATERLLLVSLADFAGPHAGNQHFCFPGQELLAQRSCVSTRQVRTLLGRLEERGLIRRERRSTREGRTSDKYWLPVYEKQEEVLSGSATGSPVQANWKSSVDQPEANFQGTIREPKEEQVLVHPPDEQPRRQRKKKPDPYDAPGFAEFWSLYPRKQSKKDAAKAWGQVTRNTAPDSILAGLRGQLPGMAKRIREADGETTFVPLPASWLRAERWEDEPERTTSRPFSSHDAMKF